MTATTTTTAEELRICRDCGKEYLHEPILAEGLDLLAGVFRCFPCSESQEDQHAREKRQREARDHYERTVPRLYRLTDLEHPDYPRQIHDIGQKWAAGHRPDDSPWFGVIGDPGLGKTRVLSQTLKRMIWKGEIPEWTNATRFSWCCENLFSNDEGKKCRYWLNRFLSAGVLVFDDLGKQKWTERVCSQFFDLLEHRNGAMLPLLWSSNESLEVLGESIPERQRGAILDRLRANSLILKIS